MGTSKSQMLQSLPIYGKDIVIRAWNHADLDEIAKWPGYPFPYEPFNSSLSNMNGQEKDQYFRKREDNPDRITLVIDHTTQRTIGYLALICIDWGKQTIGNMGFRIHPSWCDKGIGSLVIKRVSSWCIEGGISILRLDVAASNARAIRCYEKAGYVKTAEFWRDDEGLKSIDVNQPKYDFLRPHVRFDKNIHQLRFWWMELRNNT